MNTNSWGFSQWSITNLVYRLLSATWTSLPRSLRYRLWVKLEKIGAGRYGQSSSAQRLPFGMYLKRTRTLEDTRLTRLAEGHATQFVRSHTILPIPWVIDILDYRDEILLVISRLPGERLGEVLPSTSSTDEVHIALQLRPLLEQLRAIPAPNPIVCGFGCNPIYCRRLSMEQYPYGPFSSVDMFHRSLVEHGRLDVTRMSEADVDVEGCIRSSHERRHRICFTHNDLHPHNILVDQDFNITGIIDWESAGWMPEYWSVHRDRGRCR